MIETMNMVPIYELPKIIHVPASVVWGLARCSDRGGTGIGDAPPAPNQSVLLRQDDG